MNPSVEPAPSSLPTTLIRTISLEKINPQTDLLITVFSDRIQILISQKSGKIGTMVSCSHEYSQVDNSHTYHIDTLLGSREDPLPAVYARQIIEQIVSMGGKSTQYCPPLLLGITLDLPHREDGKEGKKKVFKKSSPEEFKLIVSEAVAMYRDAVQIIASNGEKGKSL